MSARETLPLQCCLCVVALLTGLPSWSTSFTISPVQISWKSLQSTGALRITNPEDTPVRVQINAVSWKNVDGVETYSDTDDIIVNPLILFVGARKTQIVRLGLRSQVASAKEASYRLFIEEVPDTIRAEGSSVRILLRFGLPILVQPQSLGAARLRWTVEQATPSSLDLAVENSGSTHEWFLKSMSLLRD